MKQVGIMSMQRIVNYGSSLQAYGLRRLIESLDSEVSVKFVDYRPGRVLAPESDGLPSGPGARMIRGVRKFAAPGAPLADRIRYLNSVRKHALVHRRRYADVNFPSLGIPNVPDYDLNLDVQVLGSDEVFNCLQANPDVGYSRDLFGHGSPARQLVSYAASFGNTTMEKLLHAGVAKDIAADLSRFESISVRDANSAEIVKALTGRMPEIHVDPVLAYDFMAEERRIPASRMHRARYIVVYAYPGRLSREENEQIRRYAKRRGLEVLSFGGPHVCADQFIDCTPFELLAYFRDAEAIITDTFHGTIFALINHRPFVTIVRHSSSHHYGNEEKLTHLLQTFGLRARVLTNPTALDSVMDRPMSGELAAILNEQRIAAQGYIEEVFAKDATR